MRKAADRVVAQLDGDEDGWWASPSQIAPIERLYRTSVSVCEHAEGSRTYGGFIFFLLQVGWWVSSPRIEPIEWNVSVCERAEGSRACGNLLPPLDPLFGDSMVEPSVKRLCL
ncbi:hypothetical protein N7471_006334 [Penicillium samsonianum]|uniref:uncharacterized protein n=1 Tax=Penicillium samsonianum TaxID=1882272 RepID=UPI002548B07B|nr:uncharacterized protein N7471_006334 [Penicillium samsonianum]KAJ6139848.1 hypothetical protein N7471_006334 [Penicillium samsonianum]